MSLDVGGHYTVTKVGGSIEGYVNIQIGNNNSSNYDPDYFKLIQREEKEMLQRDKEYDIKLTGEEIFDLYLVTGSLKGGWRLYSKFQAMLGCDIDRHIALEVDVDSIDLSKFIGYSRAVAKVFTVPETEDQRKLRELREQYESLGKAIESMEKNTNK